MPHSRYSYLACQDVDLRHDPTVWRRVPCTGSSRGRIPHSHCIIGVNLKYRHLPLFKIFELNTKYLLH